MNSVINFDYHIMYLFLIFVFLMVSYSFYVKSIHRKRTTMHEDYIKLIFDHAPFEILHLDPDYNIKNINKSGARYFNKENIIGRNFLTEFVCFSDRVKFVNMVRECSTLDDQLHCENIIGVNCGDNNKSLLSCKLVSLMGGDFIIFGYDVSYEQQKNAWNVQQQKVESITMFASGLSSDINNIFSVINKNIYLQLSDIIMNNVNIDKLKSMLQNIQSKCREASILMNSVLLLSENRSIDMNIINLRLVIATVCNKKCETPCSWKCDSDLWKVRGNFDLLRTALDHLVLNATQSISKDYDGRILITAQNQEISDNDKVYFPKGKYVCLTISDNGRGIPPDFINKVLDPFFTTKINNSGLGLSIVSVILKKHGGYITVDSELGKGTDVSLYIPAIYEH